MIIRGPILNPRADGSVDFIHDGVLGGKPDGTIDFVGTWGDWTRDHPSAIPTETAQGIICPAFLDAHIHIPQHPIRGRFVEGIEGNPPEGRLMAGLNRNVFPAEGKCADEAYTDAIVREFLRETLSKGVVGGAAYMTVHARAAEQALTLLPREWHVGMVLMNQNCPDYLRTDEANMERDTRVLHARHGDRVIVTDRFAVSVSSELRRRVATLASELSLGTQTHLNEQRKEKALVEGELYPSASSYADVYEQDGLLVNRCILAHCVHMRDAEWETLKRTGSVVAHCPTSNTLLGSGIMNLDEVHRHEIDYAICTDVGASPTTSLLAEMAQFVKVHAYRSARGSATEALNRTTLAAARVLGLERSLGSFAAGMDMSFVEIEPYKPTLPNALAEQIITESVLGLKRKDVIAHRTDYDLLHSTGLETEESLRAVTADVRQTALRLDNRVNRVTVRGKTMYNRL